MLDYIVYPDGLKKLKESGLVDRIEILSKNCEINPVYGLTDEEYSHGLLEEMQEEGFFELECAIHPEMHEYQKVMGFFDQEIYCFLILLDDYRVSIFGVSNLLQAHDANIGFWEKRNDASNLMFKAVRVIYVCSWGTYGQL